MRRRAHAMVEMALLPLVATPDDGLTSFNNGRIPFPLHPTMLRHACGFTLANGRTKPA